MRTAPPTVPGIPARHSSPESPARAVQRTAFSRLVPARSWTSEPAACALKLEWLCAGMDLSAIFVVQITMPGTPLSETSRLLPPPRMNTGSRERTAAA